MATTCDRRRKGVGHLLALLLLCIFSALGLAMSNAATSGLSRSRNLAASTDALMTAESGLQYVIQALRRVRLPNDTTEAMLISALYPRLGSRLNGTENLGGASISMVSGSIYIPRVPLPKGSFEAWLAYVGNRRVRAVVSARAAHARKTVSIDFVLTPKLPQVFDYGMASKGKILMGGKAKVIGVNYAMEANVLSATKMTREAIYIEGSSVQVTGDLFAAGPDTYVTLTGTPTIAYSSNPAVVAQHIHFGVEEPDFPRINTQPLEALAVNTVDSTTSFGTVKTYNNIRIKAGTNPKFGSNTVLNGVVFIEAPNKVEFAGSTVINGLIVTQKTATPIADCQVYFGGTVDARGVGALPDTSEFSAVKQKTGTFVLAPGFGVTFAGNFTTINGSVAADQIVFSGTAEGIIKGTVIGLEDMPSSLGGNVEVYVDRSKMDPNPAGFERSLAFVMDPDSYEE